MQVHLVIPDLFLQHEAASKAYSGLRLPALEKLLARSAATALPVATLETWLCAAFGAEAVAPVSLLAEGGHPGTAYWLRADPVHLMLRGSEVVLHPVASLSVDEAGQFCDSLNRHFSDDGLHFIAPHPDHWYLRLERAPNLATHPLAQVAGRDIRDFLPHGGDALHWHRLLNEIQMLLTAHPVNAAREARGGWLINSIWPWGGGFAPEKLVQPCARMYTDSGLAAAFARAAGMTPLSLPGDGAGWRTGEAGIILMVWDGLRHALQHGDLGEWRVSLQRFEDHCAQPLLHDLRLGRIEKVTLDVVQGQGMAPEQGGRRYTLRRGGAWQFWRWAKGLGKYAA
ncbi:MAG TPA: hypothetical protein VIU46_07000 [Gallionellaceae bacterium]